MVGLSSDFVEEKSNIIKRERISSPGLINIYHFEIQKEAEKIKLENGTSCFSSNGGKKQRFF